MNVEHISPIMNVRDLDETFAWFAELGWIKDWDFGDPADFGSVRNGQCDIFLCKDGQGARGDQGHGTGPKDYVSGTWVYLRLRSPADIDALYSRAQEAGITVAEPPMDKPWNSREVHIRHPDGHMLRIGARIEAVRS